MSKKQNPAIREFILENVGAYPEKISAIAVRKFGISRTAINNYLHRLVTDGWLIADGQTKARRYHLKKIVDISFHISLSTQVEESVIWQFRILPHIVSVPKNIIDICHHGFTEMLNNAIDHSASKDATIFFEQTYYGIEMIIIDHGVGIFEKIQKDFNLSDSRSALLELSKGKLTSNPEKHAGEGIFFTSRMFDEFGIRSGDLMYMRHRQEDDEWLIEIEDRARYRQGTAIRMRISSKADWTRHDVFKQFQGKTHVGFRKTHVPLRLARYGNEQLVSRSQAKRILARFDNFSEILLDFDGIQTIGQAFADEIFRVFKNAHPEIDIVAIRTTEDIRQMIAHVQANLTLKP
jgi:anti-sigma regulatory factor (Ser/Thr protein kinase)